MADMLCRPDGDDCVAGTYDLNELRRRTVSRAVMTDFQNVVWCLPEYTV